VDSRAPVQSALAVFNSKLYVGGNFNTLGDGTTSAKYIAAWDGSAWSVLPSGSSNGVDCGVNALAVFNSKLYVGGSFTLLATGRPLPRVSRRGTGARGRSSPAAAATGLVAGVYALAVFNSKLYVGGDFTTLGDGTTSAKRIAAWDGSAWSVLPSGSSNGLSSAVYALAVFNSKLYAGGGFTTLGDGSTSAKNIVSWDGSAWRTLASGTSNGVGFPWDRVYALAALSSRELYVGGSFTTLGDGTTSAKRIAAWNGTVWSTLPSAGSNGVGGTYTYVNALAVVNASDVFVGGNFPALGDESTRRVHRSE
jgi:trimeric autotransporter adhesin